MASIAVLLTNAAAVLVSMDLSAGPRARHLNVYSREQSRMDSNGLVFV